jgi:hypothetical protein
MVFLLLIFQQYDGKNYCSAGMVTPIPDGSNRKPASPFKSR